MIASLPMYDLPEIRSATDAFWRAVASNLREAGLGDVPQQLCRDRPLDAVWTSPKLLLSQTCGYPLVSSLAGRVRVVARPVYAAEGCDGATYGSWVVVRDDDKAVGFADLRGYRLAVNGWESQSGCNTLKPLAAALAQAGRFFGPISLTGSHEASIEAVRSGAADTAAIDCVVWALLVGERSEAIAGLRRLCATGSAPALPFITRGDASASDMEELRDALIGAVNDPALAGSSQRLLLGQIVVGEEADYEPILQMQSLADSMSYRELNKQ